jgi:hypothetical protein
MKLLIFYLTDDRRHYTFPHFIKMIKESKHKDLWQLLILTHTDDIDFYKQQLENTNINTDYGRVHPNNNYLTKVNFAIQYAENKNFPFMMKCDNDVFIKYQTLDFIIENLELLNDNTNLTLGPTLTSGIPGFEYFKDQFLDNNAKDEIDKKILQTYFYNRDGAEYSSLNKYSLESNVWNKEEYFQGVRSINHHYKGMHPIRINNDALQFLNNYIIQHKERFLSDNDLKIIDNDNSPYLCNSIFSIRTDIYGKIVRDNSLYVDDFEEVPLNKYCWKNNLKHLFVENGFAIHMYYNWKNNHIQDEIDFCNNFFK